MIKFNNSDIIDWNFDDSNIIKVYHNGAVVFYKFDAEQGGYKVCYAVVDDITKYSETEFEDVYDKATEKWYKLNNLNQYEEYGVYGSGRTSCEGSTRLPQGYTEVEYIRNSNYNAYINTGVIPYDNTSNRFTVTAKVNSEYHSNLACATIIACEEVNSPYYGFGYRYKCSAQQDVLEFFGADGTVSHTSAATSDSAVTVTFTKTADSSKTMDVPLYIFGACGNASYTSATRYSDSTLYSMSVVKNNETIRDFIPAKRDSDSVYGLYDLINDVFYTSPNGNNFIGGEPIAPTDCVTTYNGKLTIDDGYEYEWNGSSWVNLGEVSGSSRVPQGYTELTYCTVPKQSTEKFVVPYELQPYYKYSMEFTPLDFWTSSYYAILCADYSSSDNLQLFKLDNGWGTQWRRFSNTFGNYEFDTRSGKPFQDKYTVFENVKAKISFNLSGYTIGQGAVITVENEGSSAYTGVSTTTVSSSYNPTYGISTMYMMCGKENQYGRTANMKFHNFKVETSGGTAIYDYIPTKRDSDNKVGIYDVVHNEFYVPSALTLTAGDEASHTEYPKYYSEKSEPLDNLTFNTMEDAQAYAEANCVYDGMHATIDGNRYYFDSTDENGWVENQHSLPDVPFVLNYNARQYNASTHTIPYTEGALNAINAVITGTTANIIDHHEDGYIQLTGSTSTAIRALVGTTNFSRSSSSPNITIICKAYTPGSSTEGNILSNRKESYNWMYRHKSSILTFHGTSEQGSIAVSNTEPNTCSVRVNSSRLLTYNNWTKNTTSTYSNFSYGSNSNGGALFSGYYSSSGEMWKGVFYWIYMSLNTLTDEQVQQVIDYNENL